jgi:hypothetical protein
MNAQQAWDALTWRIKPVLGWLAVWPAPWVFGLGASVLAWSPAASGVKLGWTLGAAIYLVINFVVVFCAAENSGFDVVIAADLRKPWYSPVLGLALTVSSVVAIASNVSVAAIGSAAGSVLIAMLLAFVLVVPVAATVDQTARPASRTSSAPCRASGRADRDIPAS